MENEGRIRALWAKTSRLDESWHPLLWHLIDTGVVAKTMWDISLSYALKNNLQHVLALQTEEARNLIAFWCSLHDIGKAGPAFQRKSPRFITALKQIGFEFPDEHSTLHGYHGLASTWILKSYFANTINDKRFGNALAMTIGGHHGQFPSIGEVVETTYQLDHLGNDAWNETRLSIIKILHDTFDVPAKFEVPVDRNERNAVLMEIAGLITMVDWIASNEDYFPYTDPSMAISEYITKSSEQVESALNHIGFGGWSATGSIFEFQQLFPEYTPNTLQQRFIDHTSGLQPPFLAILEAPTGSGKTESAFFLADRTIQLNQQAGFYIAMPSKATSNQMFKRTLAFLTRRYPQDTLNVHLVHGAALLNDEFKKIRFTGIQQDQTAEIGHLTSAAWFLPRKKTLLAPFGIGTVDQTFQSVMRSKHFYLRMFGLSHKVVIFDEVHAYDVYMIEIFKRLLTWLRAIHTSVIILSATLPESSRIELIEAYRGDQSHLSQKEFPRLTLVSPKGTKAYSLGKPENRTVQVNWLADESIEQYCQDLLAEGGNIAIICNRVQRVQDLYARLTSIFPLQEITVFHSRFPYTWRAEIENEVLEKYGKGSQNRPQRSIVIATQVIEQSLDLDFDAIISDLAPIDLMIQRIGRLQRHSFSSTPPKRSARLQKPIYTLVEPNSDENGMPDFGNDQYVYQKYILERTYFAICGMAQLTLPEESDGLINKVYSKEYSDFIPEHLWPQCWDDYQKMVQKDVQAQLKAENMLIPDCARHVIGQVTTIFDDEHDPNSLSVIHTVTRNALPSAQVVCLRQTSHGIFTLHGNNRINLEEDVNRQLLEACLRSSISISNPALVKILFAGEVPGFWKKNPVLRTHYPLIFQEGQCQLNNMHLILDPKCGLIVTKSGN